MRALVRYSPDALLQCFRNEREKISIADFFSKPRHKKLQEMWCAARFGCGLMTSGLPCYLHIAEVDLQTEADFELEAAGTHYKFQVTEVQSPGRRRGDEYKGKSPGPWTDDDWSNGSKFGADWVRESIEKKATQYGGVHDLHLLVYLNFPAWDQQYQEVRQRVEEPASRFASAWLLTGNALGCIHQHPALPFPAGWLVIDESASQ